MTNNQCATPLVSVAIIAYNQRKFLGELLDSVVSQDYPNIEIIVADDASTDGSRELCQSYAERYPGKIICVLADVNGGITNNSNAAFRRCRGDYIAWMGGDDLMLPGKIAAQVQYMESRSQCSVSFHNVEVFESDSGVILGHFNDLGTRKIGTFRTVLRDKTYNCACATMTRTSRCPPGGFDVKLPVSSDWKFWLECLSGGGEMHYIPRVLGRYRRHNGNVTKRGGLGYKRAQADHLNTITWAMVECPQHGREAIVALAETLRQMRWISPITYFYYLKMSLSIKISFLAATSLIVYIVTFGRVLL